MEDRVIPILSESSTREPVGNQADVNVRPHGYFSLPAWQPDALEELRNAICARGADASLTDGEWTIGAYGLESTMSVDSIGDGNLQPPDRRKDDIAYFCSYQDGITRPIVYVASTSVKDLVEWIHHAPLTARHEGRRGFCSR